MPAVDSALGAAAKVGPYFSAVSFVPATVVTTATTLLLLSRPWTGQPDWSGAFKTLATPTLGQFGALLVASMVLALVLHPLQFGLVQLMEGYWGTSAVGLGLARVRIGAHLQRLRSLQLTQTNAAARAEQVRKAHPQQPHVAAPHRWTEREAKRLANQYPAARADVMPTMLGNALRRHERLAGKPYELDIVVTAAHLLLVAEPKDAEYVRDQRTQLDLATRLAMSSALMTLIAFALLAPTGWWLLLAGVPYTLSVMFYRGACTVAREYGASLYTLMDLNRPKLYERLRVPMPATLAEERIQNAVVTQLVGARRPQEMPLAPPPAAATASEGPDHPPPAT